MTLSRSSTSRGVGHVTVSYSDSIKLVREEVHWSPQGVRLLTKWHFAEGAEVEFAFDHKGERHCCKGIVVGCQARPQPQGFYETVLYFVETPCSKLQAAASDCRLAREAMQRRRGRPPLGRQSVPLQGA